MTNYLNPSSEDYTYPLGTDPKDTDGGWKIILELCSQRKHFGFDILDSFLSGPDLDNRINLLVEEVEVNGWLKDELKDALSLDQNKDLTSEQIARLKNCIKNQ